MRPLKMSKSLHSVHVWNLDVLINRILVTHQMPQTASSLSFLKNSWGKNAKLVRIQL